VSRWKKFKIVLSALVFWTVVLAFVAMYGGMYDGGYHEACLEAHLEKICPPSPSMYVSLLATEAVGLLGLVVGIWWVLRPASRRNSSQGAAIASTD